ncbi:putative lipid II flippase FtsW [Coralloluteibacterium stylophorae]|uniref:Probable peptidoglycan glycosyltransferase FtsW n=1 Tax=Coralloluteibacterium stylophorae TaxID=1776034 RepID=A0A8J7VWG5_9GAMM|nr:putative lipid II flippase FtsW [Coralloluteibacterium stylophorae]MBS7457743.1 putative lipid II flippase FtsW [Coralloluteibacterium stylophorae]
MHDAAANQAMRADEIRGRFDPALVAIVLAIASLGVVMVGSSSIAIAEGLDVGPFYFFVRHLVFLAGGLVLAAIVMRTELKVIEQNAHLALLLGFLALLVVFMPGLGKTVNGARRWIDLGISNFQTVEATKILFIVWLSSYLVRYRDALQRRWVAVLKPLGVAGAMVVLLLAQPDFGSAMLLVCVAGCMLLLGGASIPRLFAPVLVAIPAIALVAVAEPYRVRRLTSFLNPWEDPFRDGFQLTQALIAVGRGEWFGVGLGASVQKLFYLPEAHTDFIMAVIAEELGFAGVVLVVGLFALLTWRAFAIGLRAIEMRRLFSAYVAFGVATCLSLQSFVSIGVNLGLLPTKGLTLPLISSGGSSVLMTCVAIGLLLRVSYEVERAARQVALRRGEAVVEDAAPADEADAQPPVPLRTGRARVAPVWGGGA